MKKSLIIVGLFALAFAGSAYAFTEPGSAPPNGNVSAPLTGSGTSGYMPLFTGGRVVGDSVISANSGSATVNGNLIVPSGKNLYIDGAMRVGQSTSAPAGVGCATAGDKGFLYFNTSTNKTLICNGSAWADFTGPQGIQGIQGIQGTGTAGAPGTDCTGASPASPARTCQGIQGNPGTNGTSGTNGAAGGVGPQGPAGASPFTLSGSQAVYGDGGSNNTSFNTDGTFSSRSNNGTTYFGKSFSGQIQIISNVPNDYVLTVDGASNASTQGALKLYTFGNGAYIQSFGGTYGLYTSNTNTSGSSYALWCNSGRSDVGGCAGNKNWTYSSDERLKKNIKTVESGLDKALKLRGVTFNWKTDEKSEHTNLGFIAQEVMKVAPEVVTTGPDGYYMIEGGSLNAIFVEAIKELKVENDDLKARIEALEAKIGK